MSSQRLKPHSQSQPHKSLKKLTSNSTWLVFGLGNPGPQYEANRHNIGQIVVEELASKHSASFKAFKSFASVAEYRTPHGAKIVLARSTGYMNESGNPAYQLLNFYSVDVDHMIVIHDELDLEFGDVRAKFDGGHAGHNGLRDISEKCGTNYHRIRFGIGRPPGQMEVADFVLKNFNSEERSKLRELVDVALDKVENLLQ
jgi:PTH1 family peptidyl-tRNA hydrolase